MDDPLASYEDSFAGIKLHLAQTEPITAMPGERRQTTSPGSETTEQ